MAKGRKLKVSWWIGILSTVMLALLAGCMMPGEGPKAGTYEGPPTTIGQGKAHSFVTLDAGGNATRIGLRFSEAALTGLPAEHPENGREWEYVIPLPAEAASAGYDHIGVNWNPHGHIPKGVYDKPHFDFHFYMITPDERHKITAVGDDLARAHKAPPADFMPAGYVLPPGTEVADMGAHAIDPKADEFTPKGFTKTFIYGFYDGRMIFVEPMMTKAYLETKPNDLIAVALPQKYSRPGDYPTHYGVKYDEARREYDISLEDLVPQKAAVMVTSGN